MASSDTARLIRLKDGDITQFTTNINKDINSIRGMLTIDKTNGLSGLTVKSTNLLGKDGLIDPKANFFDIYYDEQGKPYFLFNQFNPLFGNYLSRDKTAAQVNACSYCSTANAFILAYGVHSVVDSFGIYLFTLDRGRKSQSPINNGQWLTLLDGSNKDWKVYDNYNIVRRYALDKNGKPIFKTIKSGDLSDQVGKAIGSGRDSARFVFNTDVGNNAKKIQAAIDAAEKAGYHVRVEVGNAAGGKDTHLFGSLKGSGHYVGLEYTTDGGGSVVDSFGSRSSKADRAAGTELRWSSKGQPLEYHEKDSQALSSIRKKGKHNFWHDSTVMTGTDYDSFSGLVKGAEVGGSGITYFIIEK